MIIQRGFYLRGLLDLGGTSGLDIGLSKTRSGGTINELV